MSIGKRLNQWRKENNIKTTDLRDSTGISLGAISNYENDKREISTSFLLKIREVYNADIYYILTGVKKDKLSEDEIELLNKFRILPEKEKQRFIGRLDDRIEELNEGKSSGSAVG